MKPEILSISTKYGKVGWIVYRGEQNLFDCKFFSSKKDAQNSLK